MFGKFVAFCFLICAVLALDTEKTDENHTWDLAVTIADDEIQLLTKNGTLIKSITDKFTDIKAVAYHYQKNQFIVGNRDNDDTIYLLDPNSLNVTTILNDLKDDIQGIAVDPLTEIVYWTDATNRNINYKSMRGLNATQSTTTAATTTVELQGTKQYETLFDFLDQKPQDLAIDSCKRMIYWTNANMNTPTIEKSTIMGTDRKVLIADVMTPTGIVIDQLDQRLYWTDMLTGIYFRIESIDLDGHDRQLHFEGTHQKPFGLTVDKDFVYWTDINNNALWRMRKFSSEEPEQIYTFTKQPNGIMSRFVGFPEEPNCDKLAVLIKQRQQAKEKEKLNNGRIGVANENKTCPICVHGTPAAQTTQTTGGNESGKNCSCTCFPGYTGDQCEMDVWHVCHNYCQNGRCTIGENNKAQCSCELGFSGSRCERNLCDNFCLNGGFCHVMEASRGENGLVCTCPENFSGDRCEVVVPVSNYEVCKALCANSNESVVVRDEKSFLCRCSDLSYMSLEVTNRTQQAVLASVFGDFDTLVVNHPFTIALMCSNILTMFVVIALVVYTCRMKRIRPRIKKRVVVNKNITPLTYRPQVEQCEITIEDCCNMNICETPCFEPRNFQPKKDEKKVLLANMENNEEFY